MDIDELINIAKAEDVTAEYINEIAKGQEIDNIGEHLKTYVQLVKYITMVEDSRPIEVTMVDAV